MLPAAKEGRSGFFQKHDSSPQTELLQGHSLYFWQLLFHKLMVVVVAAEEVEADARGHTSCSPFPLQSVGLGHKGVLQTFHPFAWVISTGQQETGWCSLRHRMVCLARDP